MKKRTVSLLLVVVMLLTLTAYAAPRAATISPLLEFDGKTAYCYVDVVGNSSSDKIVITASLWRGSTCLATWTESGTEIVSLSESKAVSISGVTYKLTADVTINGRVLPQVETTAKCP